MTDMTGKVALLTGGAGEIGVATAKELADRGATVVAVDLDGCDWSNLKAAAPNAIMLHANVTKAEDWEKALKDCTEQAGVPHMFFNNAGIEGHVKPIHETEQKDFEMVMAVNVTGVFLGMKYVIPAMIANGGGSVINTSSVAGLAGSPGMVAYVASKHAVVGMTRTAAREYAGHNIRVNTVHPGMIDSRMMDSLEDGMGKKDDHMNTMIPMGRHGKTDEIAKLVAFLLSDDASYCTGGRYTADGGLTEV